MRYLTAFLLCMLALPATAQTINIDRDACAKLVAHTPTPDTTYQPGIDVEGRKVASADLDAPQVNMPSVITIPVSSYLAADLGIPANRLSASTANLGYIRVEGNNVYFNGQPIGSTAQENLGILCMHANPG